MMDLTKLGSARPGGASGDYGMSGLSNGTGSVGVSAPTRTPGQVVGYANPDPSKVYTSGASDPYASQTMGMANINMPSEWDWAMNMYKNYANGAGRVRLPGEWQTGVDTLTGMAENGNPVDISGWWEAQQPVFATQLADYTKQAAEEAGMGGTRWSTPLLRNIADFTQRGYDELTATAMAKQLEADEAARARMIEGANSLLPYIKYKSDLQRSNASSRYAAIGDVLGLATQKFWAPMQVAQGMSGIGNSLYGQQSNQVNELTNPAWTQGAMGALGMSEQAGYNPSFSSNMLGIAGELLPYALGGGMKEYPIKNTVFYGPK